MRGVDQSAMIADLGVKLDRLQSELHDMRTRPSVAGVGSYSGPRSREDADGLASYSRQTRAGHSFG
jgi:hypothetical protein